MLAAHAVYPGGTRRNLTNIHVQVQFVTQAFPLLPFVFFGKDSASIPPRYAQLSSTEGFSSLALEPNPVVLHLNVLNIVGERMRSHPVATITIHGYADSATENGDCALAHERAETLRAYLTGAWGIDPARVAIKTAKKNCLPDFMTITRSEDGYADNRRAVIESSDPAVLAPIPRNRFTEPLTATPPALEFDPVGTTSKGVASWRIITMQSGRILFADSGAGEPMRVEDSLGAEQAAAMQEGAPLVCTLSIADTGGRVSSMTDTIPVARDTLETEIERLTLTLFGTASDRISGKDSAAIRNFLADFDPEDSITILGYADSLIETPGDTLYNKRLSERRAASVRALIGTIAPPAEKISSEGVANAKFPPGIFSYRYPEERFLSRTVRIEVRKKLGK